jgi:hypothetical protein
MVNTLNTLPKAVITSSIASGIAMIPPTSSYMMTNEVGYPSDVFLIKRQGFDSL